MAGLFDDDDFEDDFGEGSDLDSDGSEEESDDIIGIDNSVDDGSVIDENEDKRKMVVPVILMGVVIIIAMLLLYGFVKKGSSKEVAEKKIENVTQVENTTKNEIQSSDLKEENINESKSSNLINEDKKLTESENSELNSVELDNRYNKWKKVEPNYYEDKEAYEKLESVVVRYLDYYLLEELNGDTVSSNLKSVMTVTKEGTGETYSIDLPYIKASKVKIGMKIKVYFHYIDIKDKRILVGVSY